MNDIEKKALCLIMGSEELIRENEIEQVLELLFSKYSVPGDMITQVTYCGKFGKFLRIKNNAGLTSLRRIIDYRLEEEDQ